MKRTLSVILCLFMTIGFAFTAFADDFDLAEAGSGDMAEFAAEIAAGTRLFDQAGVLDSSGAEELEARLKEFEKTYGQMPVIVTVKNESVSDDLDVYADRLYTAGSLGTGADRDGILLILNMGENGPDGVHIYAQSGAMRFMTDKAIDQIYDEYGGGIYSPLRDGEYEQAFLIYMDALNAIYRQGIQSGQYNYDPETGEKDYYKPKKSVKLWHVIAALLIGAVSAYLPVASVKRQYAMTAEKRRARYVNLAYRSTSAFAFTGTADSLLNTRVVHIPIPKPESSGGSGGPGLGGGRSTMHRSGGGGSHTSGGRKF